MGLLEGKKGLILNIANDRSIATYIATDPGQNINWVFGPGAKPQQMLPPLAYLALEMTMLPVIVILPMHFLLKHLFAPT